MKKGKCNDYEQILTHALNELKEKQGTSFDPQKINLAELERMTGISRSRLRRFKKNNFKVLPNGNKGRKASVTVLSGFTGMIDDLLKKNVTNSSVIFDRISANGF